MSLWIELKCDLCNKLFDSVYYSRDAVTELKRMQKQLAGRLVTRVIQCVKNAR